MRKRVRRPATIRTLLGLGLFGYFLTQAVIQGVNGLIISYLNLGIGLVNSVIAPEWIGKLMSISNITEVLF